MIDSGCLYYYAKNKVVAFFGTLIFQIPNILDAVSMEWVDIDIIIIIQGTALKAAHTYD